MDFRAKCADSPRQGPLIASICPVGTQADRFGDAARAEFISDLLRKRIRSELRPLGRVELSSRVSPENELRLHCLESFRHRSMTLRFDSPNQRNPLSSVAVGLLTRVAALGIACVMLVAITVHWPQGFFMNWYGNQKGEGFEYHLLALGIAITLIIVGAGAWSLDGALAGPR